MTNLYYDWDVDWDGELNYSISRNKLDKPTVASVAGSIVFTGANPDWTHRNTLPAEIGGKNHKIYAWYKCGQFHRLDGPAEINPSSRLTSYYIDGVEYTKNDWEVQRLKHLRLHLR